jgi:ParB family transcriptional regulator, chromosome partitioning protein
VVPLLATSSTWNDREELNQARLERAPLSPEAEARIAAIEAEQAEVEAEWEENGVDEVSIAAMNERINELEREEAELRNTDVTLDDERKASLTQFVVIGKDGKPQVEASYWEPARRHGSAGGSATKYVDPAKAAAKAAGLNGVLADELAMARRDVLALHVASDPGTALDLAIFALAERAVGKGHDLGSSLMVSSRNDPISRGAVQTTPALGTLAEIRKGLQADWVEHSTIQARFDAFREMPDDMRASWLAVCVASSLEASIGCKALGRHNSFHDHLGQLLDINVAEWWRPSASGYFARVRKAGMQKTLQDIGGPVLAAKYASAKSAEMADACEKLCAGGAITEPEIRDAALAWLPAAMRFDGGSDEGTEATDEPADETSDADTDDSGTGESAAATSDDEDDNRDGLPGDEDAVGKEDEASAAADNEPMPDSGLFGSYAALKAEAVDAILLYRMGDFYEVFGPDAAKVASLLGLALTRRSADKTSDATTEMVGIPVHAAEAYIAQLIAVDIRVAIAERCEAEGGGLAHAIIRVISEAAARAEGEPEDALAA